MEAISPKLPEKSRSLVIMYMRQVLDARDTPAQVQRLLANFEIAADKDLAISINNTMTGTSNPVEIQYKISDIKFIVVDYLIGN